MCYNQLGRLLKPDTFDVTNPVDRSEAAVVLREMKKVQAQIDALLSRKVS